MKILFCGDVVGSSGRAVLADHLPDLRRDLQLDFLAIVHLHPHCGHDDLSLYLVYSTMSSTDSYTGCPARTRTSIDGTKIRCPTS